MVMTTTMIYVMKIHMYHALCNEIKQFISPSVETKAEFDFDDTFSVPLLRPLDKSQFKR